MSARCALLVDSDNGFADSLRAWLSDSALELTVTAEWKDELREEVDPALIFVAVDLPEKTGFLHCRRARERAPEVPIILATATIAADELELNRQAESADACFDKRTVTREVLAATVAALIDTPSPAQDPAQGSGGRAGSAEPDLQTAGRVAELEEEVRRLRWELDETRLAAQGAPHSRDFLRLSGVVASKEKEVVRLKKEISAREHKIATTHRTLRELSTRAASATREREQVAGHVAQLGRDVENAEAEVLRLRVDAKRNAEEAKRATASLKDERRRHAETRRRHEETLGEHAAALDAVRTEQLGTREDLERELQREKAEALSALFGEWRERLRRRRRENVHALALLEDRLRDVEAARQGELDRRDDEHRAAQRGTERRLAAEAKRELEEQRQRHEAAMAEALAAHAVAEKRGEEHRAAQRAAAARLEDEKAAAIAAAEVELERRLDEMRRGYASSLAELRQHFQEQLRALQEAEEERRSTELGGHETARRRAEQELAAARARAAQDDRERRQEHERELAELRAGHVEASAALEKRLREEHQQALDAASAEGESRLVELGRQHAASTQTLRERFHEQLEALQESTTQELTRRDGEREATRRSDAEELSAARARATQHELEIAQRHEQELAQVEARQAEARTALETRLHGERDQAVAATIKAWEAKLEQQRRAFQDQISLLQAARKRALAEKDEERESALAEVAAERASERAGAERQREELRERYEGIIEELREERDEADRRAAEEHRSALGALEARLLKTQDRTVATTVAEWEERLEQLRLAHAGSIEVLRRENLDRLGALQASAAKEATQGASEHQAALRRVREELAAARSEAAALDKETREHYELELARVEAAHREALSACDARLREEQEQAVAATVATWEQKLEALRRDHAASLERLRREHREQVASLGTARQQELVARDDEYEAELGRLREELSAARKLVSQQEREARQRNGPGPALSPERHAEALRALESRLREEQDRAVASAVAEWKAKMDRLRRGHADTVAALRREHQDQLDALQSARALETGTRPPAVAGQSDKVVALKTATGERSR